MSENISVNSEALEKLNGKYLLFHVANTLYGVPLTLVTEIIQTNSITHLPGVAHHIKGILNLRGKIVPVIDVRLKFGLEERPYDDKTCIIVLDIHDMQIGLWVDSVSEVLSVDSTQLALPPKTKEMAAWYISSIVELGKKIVLNIDFDKFLKDDLAVTTT